MYCSDLDLRGPARIVFASSTNMTNKYLFPLLEVMGNFPVWSEKTLPPNSTIFNDTNLFARTGFSGGSVVIIMSLLGVEVVDFILVDRRFCLIFRRYSLTVAVDLSRYF